MRPENAVLGRAPGTEDALVTGRRPSPCVSSPPTPTPTPTPMPPPELGGRRRGPSMTSFIHGTYINRDVVVVGFSAAFFSCWMSSLALLASSLMTSSPAVLNTARASALGTTRPSLSAAAMNSSTLTRPSPPPSPPFDAKSNASRKIVVGV